MDKLDVLILKDCKIGSNEYKKGAKITLNETMNIYYMESDGYLKVIRPEQETLL